MFTDTYGMLYMIMVNFNYVDRYKEESKTERDQWETEILYPNGLIEFCREHEIFILDAERAYLVTKRISKKLRHSFDIELFGRLINFYKDWSIYPNYEDHLCIGFKHIYDIRDGYYSPYYGYCHE